MQFSCDVLYCRIRLSEFLELRSILLKMGSSYLQVANLFTTCRRLGDGRAGDLQQRPLRQRAHRRVVQRLLAEPRRPHGEAAALARPDQRQGGRQDRRVSKAAQLQGLCVSQVGRGFFQMFLLYARAVWQLEHRLSSRRDI